MLAELCQTGLIEAVGSDAFFKDNAQLVDYLFSVVSRRFPFYL